MRFILHLAMQYIDKWVNIDIPEGYLVFQKKRYSEGYFSKFFKCRYSTNMLALASFKLFFFLNRIKIDLKRLETNTGGTNSFWLCIQCTIRSNRKVRWLFFNSKQTNRKIKSWNSSFASRQNKLQSFSFMVIFSKLLASFTTCLTPKKKNV